jgi:uncharacterized membrane protein YsdA (DUF1294 family)
MAIVQTETGPTSTRFREQAPEIQHEKWKPWHVNWTAIWVGVLASFSAILVFGLLETAVGAHLIDPDHRVVHLKTLGMSALVFGVFGAFLSFVVGGWVAGKIAGILHAEPGMLYGAIVWLLTIPILVVMAGAGASTLMGIWFDGLSGSAYSASAEKTPFVRPVPLPPDPTLEETATYRAQWVKYNRDLRRWSEDTPDAARNSAIGAVAAMMMGLIGSVLGGWMAAGEPMSLAHHRTRKPQYHSGLGQAL